MKARTKIWIHLRASCKKILQKRKFSPKLSASLASFKKPVGSRRKAPFLVHPAYADGFDVWPARLDRHTIISPVGIESANLGYTKKRPIRFCR